eukprot:TRINITY_DN1632_c2_g1_i4.p1 TRINITY_DN1632_c2_g1~~TRINITY_DN1632_c2_g1_i4.p1  ORF type:complete len:1194 (-),score=395.22 TRINITY_DN1632_c2_g1_i4:56-3592(-)
MAVPASIKELLVAHQEEDPMEQLVLEAVIAEGSFGIVYKGYHSETQQRMAVKIVELDEEDTLQDLAIEVEVLAQCAHPNIVGFFGCWQKDEELFIAMEYCDGGSAADIYAELREPFKEQIIARVMRESLAGLAYLHQNGIVHRDIKGGNIMIDSKGQVKLIDFGVSGRLNETAKYRLTFIGTPYWMAPEIIDNKTQVSPYDYQADVWSLGITVYELAHIGPPLGDMHPMKALMQIPFVDPPKAKQPNLWGLNFHSFMAACLVKDPKKRATVAELQQHAFLQVVAEPEELSKLVSKYIATRDTEDEGSGDELAGESESGSESDEPELDSFAATVNPVAGELFQSTPAPMPPPTPASTNSPPPPSPSPYPPPPPSPSPYPPPPPLSPYPPPPLSPYPPQSPLSPSPPPPLSPLASPTAAATPSPLPQLLSKPPPLQLPPKPQSRSPSPSPSPLPSPSTQSADSAPLKASLPHGTHEPVSVPGELSVAAQQSRSRSPSRSPSRGSQQVSPTDSNQQEQHQQPPATPQPAAPEDPLPVAAVPKQKHTQPTVHEKRARPTATMKRDRPMTVHKTAAKRDLAAAQNVNRKLVKQQLQEIKQQQRQHQRDTENMEAKQTSEKQRLLRAFADRNQRDQRRYLQEEEAATKRAAADREAQARKHRAENEVLERQLLNGFKAWQRDHVNQQRNDLKQYVAKLADKCKQEASDEKKNRKQLLADFKDARFPFSHKLERHLDSERKLRQQLDQDFKATLFDARAQLHKLREENQLLLLDRHAFERQQQEQESRRRALELSLIDAQQQRQRARGIEERAIGVESVTRIQELALATQEQRHSLATSQAQRRMALELDQHRRQVTVESRERLKEFRRGQRAAKERFCADSKLRLRQAQQQTDSAGRRSARQEAAERQREYERQAAEDERRFLVQDKARVDAEDADIAEHQRRQRERMDELQRHEREELERAQASALEHLRKVQTAEFEEQEMRQARQVLARLSELQRDELALLHEQREQHRLHRSALQGEEDGFLSKACQDLLLLVQQQNNQQAPLVAMRHQLQIKARAKQLKREHAPQKRVTAELELLAAAHTRELELCSARQDAELAEFARCLDEDCRALKREHAAAEEDAARQTAALVDAMCAAQRQALLRKCEEIITLLSKHESHKTFDELESTTRSLLAGGAVAAQTH